MSISLDPRPERPRHHQDREMTYLLEYNEGGNMPKWQRSSYNTRHIIQEEQYSSYIFQEKNKKSRLLHLKRKIYKYKV